MKLWSYSLREIWRRPGRTVLTLLGIIIGVAAVVAVTSVTAATSEAYRQMFTSVSGKAALEIVAEGRGGFDQALAREIEAVAGVRSVVPVVQTPAALLTADGTRTMVLVLGVDPALDSAARTYELEEGASFVAEGQAPGQGAEGAQLRDGAAPVLLEASFARSLGLAPGEQALLITPSGPGNLEVRGLVSSRGTASFNGGAVLYIPLPEAQRLFRLEGQVNSLQLVLDQGVQEAEVETAVRATLPLGLTVQTPASRGAIAEDTLLSTEQGLNSVSALSLVAAVFIVLNAFLMNMGERRREIAMLRALGATRSQVVRLVLREAGIMAVLGSFLGILVGIGASSGLISGVEGLVAIDLPPVSVRPEAVFLGLLLGLGVSLLAAYIPARWGSRVPPLEGLVGECSATLQGRRRWPAYLGLGLVALGLLLAAGLTFGRLAPPATAPAMAVLTVGLVLAIPLALRPLSRLAARLLVPLLGTEGRLALRQLDRHPTRTSLTVGVLFVAVIVALSMGSSMLNNIRDTGDWYERTIVGDYFIRGAMPEIGTSSAAALPEELGDKLAALDGVERVDPLRFIPGRAEGRDVIVIARTFAPDRSVPLDLHEGDPDEVLAGLLRGEAVVGTGLAQKARLEVGGELILETRQGPQRVRVAGTTTEYTGGGSALYLSWDRAKELLDAQGADLFLVTAQAGEAAGLAPRLEELSRQEGFMIQTLEEFRLFIDEMIQGVVGFLWLLLALLFVVASLGIVNTLTMNVLEQTRELGLLRAVAMTRRQVRKLVLSQALAVASISLLPGLAAGVAIAFLLNRATYPVLGHPVAFRIDLSLLAGTFVVAFAVSVAAAWFPARRAARLEVVKALQYE